MVKICRSIIFIAMFISGTVFAACEQLAVDTSQGTVRDTRGDLIWSRCLDGQTGGECFGAGNSLSWVDALNKARGSELGTIGNWRLPKIEELEKLFKSGCLTAVFPGAGAATVWSASANLDYATDAWAFDFSHGVAVIFSRDSPLQVMLVANPN